jgi:hypothetical protein
MKIPVPEEYIPMKKRQNKDKTGDDACGSF